MGHSVYQPSGELQAKWVARYHGFCQAVVKICSMSVRMHLGNKLNHGTSWLSGYLYSKGK